MVDGGLNGGMARLGLDKLTIFIPGDDECGVGMAQIVKADFAKAGVHESWLKFTLYKIGWNASRPTGQVIR